MRFPFFSRSRSRWRRAAQPAAALPPAYDPGLISSLTEEHAQLLVLLRQMRQAAKEVRYTDVDALLLRFAFAYEAHQQRKETQLLPYIEHYVQMESGRSMLRNLTSSGSLTQRSVLGFLRHYRAMPVSDRSVRRFGWELDGVIEELSRRLDTESASLHGLYLPAHEY